MQALWFTWLEMAPFLLVGFLIAGVLHVFLDKDRVLRLLGKDGPMQTLRAVVLGIPIPVCSCGVIPISATLREKGAGPGATAGFMLTTPQTGIDSIYATAGILGGPLAAVRVLAALVSGIAAGIAAQQFSEQSVVNKDEQAIPGEDSCCGDSHQNESPKWTHKIDEGLRFGLVTLPKDVFWPIVIGVVIAALAQAFLPTNLWGALDLPLWAGYLFVIAISLPVYVCSTGAIPIAWTLSIAGLSPGAVLIFLVAGPATNAGTFSMLVKCVGIRAALAALITLSGIILLMGSSIDFFGIDLLTAAHPAHHEHLHDHSLFEVILSVMTAVLFLASILSGWADRIKPKTRCCDSKKPAATKSCCQS